MSNQDEREALMRIIFPFYWDAGRVADDILAAGFTLTRRSPRMEWEHDRDCLYVTSVGPAPCTCAAGKIAADPPPTMTAENTPRILLRFAGNKPVLSDLKDGTEYVRADIAQRSGTGYTLTRGGGDMREAALALVAEVDKLFSVPIPTTMPGVRELVRARNRLNALALPASEPVAPGEVLLDPERYWEAGR